MIRYQVKIDFAEVDRQVQGADAADTIAALVVPPDETDEDSTELPR